MQHCTMCGEEVKRPYVVTIDDRVYCEACWDLEGIPEELECWVV